MDAVASRMGGVAEVSDTEMRSIGIPPGDIGWFETLNEVPASEFGWSVGPTHTKDLRELSAKLDRLQQIIERHDARPRVTEASASR